MNCDGVIFDLDGTLWDSTGALTDIWALALANEPDIPRPPTREELGSVMGMTAPQLMKKLFPHLSPERGAETLAALAGRFPLAIVSNCGPEYIPAFFAAHGLEKYFADWECIGRTGRPKWDNIRLVAERLHLAHPVYVGD